MRKRMAASVVTAKQHGLKVVLAFDNDEGGLDFTLKATKHLLDQDIPYLIKRPKRRKDWNEILCLQWG